VRRVLLTGAAGRIAAAVRPVLRELADELVLTDRVHV
jgi:nucleoside-diphosphate-sugar epimerase